MLAGRQLTAAGAMAALPPGRWQQDWEALSSKYPAEFLARPPAVPPSRELTRSLSPDWRRFLELSRVYFDDLSDNELKSGHFPEAIAAAEHSLKVTPRGLMGRVRLVNALVFAGQLERARTICLENLEKPWKFKGKQTVWRQVALQELRDVRLRRTHPDMEQIEQLLEPRPTTAPSN